MKFSRFFLPLLLFAIFSCNTVDTEIIKVKCNYKDLATGIEQDPFFSWQVSSGHRSVYQEAYQIIVSDNKKDIGKNKGNIWNSGKIKSGKSINVGYRGGGLQSSTRYYFRVKIWNNKGEETKWGPVGEFITGLLSPVEWNNAKWVAHEKMETERLVPGLHSWGNKLGGYNLPRPVVPMFRKEFTVTRQLKTAILHICGLGQYEAYINGDKISDEFLSPAWSDYDKTCYYNTYDITKKIKNGENTVGAIVGNGFYNINKERYRKLVIAYGKPSLIVKLALKYEDGGEEYIITDESWRSAPSPIKFSSIYSGENYDAREEKEDWGKAGFDGAGWSAVHIANVKGGLKSQGAYPLKVMEEFNPVEINKINTDTFVYDFGQNASGTIELKVKGNRGDTLRIWPAELVKENGKINQRATGRPYYFEYVLKGGAEEIWRPRFTYYGFRYAQVEGAVPKNDPGNSGSPVILHLKHLHTRSSSPRTGYFECSNELFNKTYRLINYAVKSNITTVLTDCPHREKLGWLEQTYLMGGSVHYNFDIYHLYKKIVFDMMDAQKENGFVPNIVPEYVVFGDAFTDSPEWGSAAVILPWLLHSWYGDKEIVDMAWPMMQNYMGYLTSGSNGYILNYGLGDWFDLGPGRPGFSQLTPKAVTATSIFYYDAILMSKMARLLKREKDTESYALLAGHIKEAFNKKFYNEKTGVFATGSQTAQAMPYCVGLVDEKYKNLVVQNLVDSIMAHDKALTAGDIGFHFLVEALTDAGKSELLYEMNNRDDVPGYGFQLKKGATALTESWQALPDVSNNHLMLGHIMQWFYEGLGGINQADTSVAYKTILICPGFLNDINYAQASFEGPYGEISTYWEKKEGRVELQCKVPVNSDAMLKLPAETGRIKENGLELRNKEGITQITAKDGITTMKLGSGTYHFAFDVNKNQE